MRNLLGIIHWDATAAVLLLDDRVIAILAKLRVVGRCRSGKEKRSEGAKIFPGTRD